MAVRRPLILTGDNDLIEMTDAQIDAVKDRCRYLYGANPSVTLSYANTGNLSPQMRDNRKIAGDDATSISAIPPASVTDDIGDTHEDYDHINQNVSNVSATPDINNIAFPIYYTGSNIKTMSLTDFRDTFILPAIDTLTSSSNQPGMFRIHNDTTLGGHTRIGSTIQYVFQDTRADADEYTAAGIPEDVDQPTVINKYYIYKKDNISPPSMEEMLFVRNSDNNLQEYTQSAIDALLQNEIRNCAANVASTRIRYNINGSGTTMGTSMVDTRLDGTGEHAGADYGGDDYRAQEFPNGNPQTVNTWTLRVNQT